MNQMKRCSGRGHGSSRGRDRTLAGGGLTRTELEQPLQSTKICYFRVVLQLNQSRAGLTVQKASALQALANIMRLGCHLRHAGGPAWPGNAAASVPSWHRQKRTALSVHPAGKAGDFCVCDSMISLINQEVHYCRARLTHRECRCNKPAAVRPTQEAHIKLQQMVAVV